MQQGPMMPETAKQSSDDIADVIISCMNDDEPRLRYATNEYGEEQMKVAFSVGIGDKTAKHWSDKMMPVLDS